tara:strand:+ start:1744 stop:1911 length:168 start_codon:yes stop_codon:yes gene_type:complete
MEPLEELDKLKQCAELLRKEALRGVVSPPDFKTPARINESYETIINYINQQKSKQ